jgi:hypothetical protein
MVGWYSPRLLLKAGVEVLVSTLFGQHADQRTVQALTGSPKVANYTGGERQDDLIEPRLRPYRVDSIDAKGNETSSPPEMWFDYIADVGDGWDSTYSIAWLATRKELNLTVQGEQKKKTLRQGQVLIFGGDQVYPTASRSEYDRRFIAPYQSALNDGEPREHADIYAIPGNHDWYDSLRSFSRIFFSDIEFVKASKAPTETPQTRSYFAIRLPSNWWILGTDVQLGSDIDANQLEYFRTVAKSFGDDDKVVLCTAEPHWSTAKKAEKRESISAPSALDRLEQEVLGSRVRVFVAGDVHHYMRFESGADESSRVHKITAGGGGAFLHPTHRTWDQEIEEPVTKPGATPRAFRRPAGAVFPTPTKSLTLSFRNWLFAFSNPRFGILTATLYVVFALMMMPAFMRHDNELERQEQARLTKQKEQLQQKFTEEVNEFMALASENDRVAVGPAGGMASSSEATFNEIQGNVLQVAPDSKIILDRVRARFPVDESSTTSDVSLSEQARKKFQHMQNVSNQLEQLSNSLHEVTKGDYVVKMSRSFRRHVNVPHQPPAAASDRAGDRAGDHVSGTASTPAPEVEVASSDHDQAAIEELHEGSSTDIEERRDVAQNDQQAFLPWAYNYFLVLSRQEVALPDPFQSMLAILVFLSAIAAFIAFTDVPNTLGRVTFGALHGCVHWAAAYIITLIAAPLIASTAIWTCGIVAVIGLSIATACGVTSDTPHQGFLKRSMMPLTAFGILTGLLIYLISQPDLINSAVVVVVFVAGWVVGSFIMGGYLFLAHSIFGQHWNEAFSAIRCKDWKCFLRFHLSGDGQLTIYPVGVPRVCRNWVASGDHMQPASPSDLQPILIEQPIVLR